MSICLACGLCCSGAVFTHGSLKPDEEERAERIHLRILREEGVVAFLFPCPAHTGVCSVYDDRPSVCVEYSCETLRSVEDGSMPRAEAEALLARTRALAESVRARVPGVRALWADVGRFVQDSIEWRREHASLLLDIGELRQLISRIEPDVEAAARQRTTAT